MAAIDPATVARLAPDSRRAFSCPARPGAVCFERQGIFHEPTGAPTLPIQAPRFRWKSGVTYRSLRVQLTFRHGRMVRSAGEWHPQLLLDLRLRDWAGTYGYMNARGPNRNVVTMLTKGWSEWNSDTSRPKVPTSACLLEPPTSSTTSTT